MNEDNKKVPGMDKAKETVKEAEPGLRGAKTTNVFRIVNFELFTKPNKRAMGAGGFAFLFACGYLVYMRATDELKGVPTYTTVNEDGSLTRRVKPSKWD